MAWLDNAVKTGGGGHGIILTANKPRKVRVLHGPDEPPLQYWQHTIPDDKELGRSFSTVVCGGRNSCILCQANGHPNFAGTKNKDKPYPVKPMYAVSVYDYETSKVAILTQGNMLFKDIDKAVTIKGSLLGYDLHLLKSGQGLTTEYSATPDNDSRFAFPDAEPLDLASVVASWIPSTEEIEETLSGGSSSGGKSTQAPPKATPKPAETKTPAKTQEKESTAEVEEPPFEEDETPVVDDGAIDYDAVITVGGWKGMTVEEAIGEDDMKKFRKIATFKALKEETRVAMERHIAEIDGEDVLIAGEPDDGSDAAPTEISAPSDDGESYQDKVKALARGEYENKFNDFVIIVQKHTDGNMGPIDDLTDEQAQAIYQELIIN